MVIRKISIGADYKNSAMHYVMDQPVLGGTHKIHNIRINDTDGTIRIWIMSESKEVILWKSFSANMPYSIEYNIDF
jgi:DNA/RNA endonuclease YhcR with UshA esterase domain